MGTGFISRRGAACASTLLDQHLINEQDAAGPPVIAEQRTAHHQPVMLSSASAYT
jgi:hypothetical protein